MFPSLWLTMALGAQAADGVFPYPIHTKTLDNGLTVHVVPMQTPDVVAAYVWFDVGSRDEVDAGRTGFAHFFEHLMFYGTPTLAREAREREIVRLGADENAWTWMDETVYHAVLSSESLPRYLEMQADLFQNLALTEEDVRREAGAVYGEFRKSQADPGNQVMVTMYATAFTTHTYGHDTIGYEADIAAMPTAFPYSQQFFRRFYRPENATVIVAGDADPEAVFATIQEDWADWKPVEEPRPVVPAEPRQQGLREAHIDWPTPTAAQIAFGWRVPADDVDDPDVAALELAAQLLLSPVGPLHRRLVEEEGIAYTIWGGRDQFVDPGLLQVGVVLEDPKHLERARVIVKEEVAKLQESVDAALLDATRSNARYGFLTALDDPNTVAYAVGHRVRREGSPDAIDRFYVLYDAVTPERVSEVARQYLVDDQLTVVTLATKEAD